MNTHLLSYPYYMHYYFLSGAALLTLLLAGCSQTKPFDPGNLEQYSRSQAGACLGVLDKSEAYVTTSCKTLTGYSCELTALFHDPVQQTCILSYGFTNGKDRRGNVIINILDDVIIGRHLCTLSGSEAVCDDLGYVTGKLIETP